MKKYFFAALVLLLLFDEGLRPFQSRDAAELYVIETLIVDADKEEIRFYTADGVGAGKDGAEAISALAQQVPGELFLRQVKRVVLCDEAKDWINELPKEIPLGALVYTSEMSGEKFFQQLSAWEKRRTVEETAPRLAEILNQALKEKGRDSENQ